MTVQPKFELLEDRIVLDGDAQVTVTAPATIDIGQQDVGYTLTFDNVSATETGYVPFIDVILPTLGTDGYDGVTFDGATFLGAPVTTYEIVFDAAGEAEHPLAVDASGDPLIVSGTPGETLVVFELPYGSFSPGNPPVDIEMNLDFSELADLSDPFAIQSRAGFALGCDPLDNPADDPSSVSDFATTTVQQELFEVNKRNNLPEEEGATGPSYVYQYTLEIDVAPGQTLNNFTLTDNLPPEIVYMGGLNAAGGTVVTEPTVGSIAGPGNDVLEIFFPTVSGTTQVTFDFYINDVPAGEVDPLLNVNTGDASEVTNRVTGSGFWDPLDTNDGSNIPVSDSANSMIEAVSLAIQKSGTIITDTGIPGPTPDDVYEFTLDIQVSDYFTYGDIVVTDILGNGFEYIDDSAQIVMTSEDGGESILVPISLAGFETTTTDDPALGRTTNVWDISAAMMSVGDDGLLTGDDVDGSFDGVQTTVQIVYRARVLDQYADDGTVGDPELSQGDLIGNDTEVSATVRDNDDPDMILGTETDESGFQVQLPFGQIREKSVFALNGAPPDPNVTVSAGDTVTFRIVYDAPLGSFENLRIADNLPQNVFDATEVTFFDPAPADNSLPPPAGVAYFGPADEFSANGGGTPTLNVDGPNNGVEFIFNNLSVDPRQAVALEVLFTVTVEDAIFADDLLLTNQATAFESNSFGGEVQSTAIAQFVYAEPVLEITKGVIATDSPDPATTFTDPVGPVAFTVPGSAGPRWAGTINSDGLDATPVDSDIFNVDAGDLVSFAIVVENVGRGPNGAFNVVIEDTLPPGFSIPPGGAGLNLNVTDGTGTRIIPFTGDLFTTGIELEDRNPTNEGSLSSFDPTAGDNIVVITYDLVVDQSVTSNDFIQNTATLSNYTAFEGTPANVPIDRTPEDLTDNAFATVENVQITKVLTDREFGEQGSSEVMVGEEFTFTVRFDIQEGTYTNAIVTDTVRTGGSFGDYEILSAEIVTWDVADLSASTGITLGSAGTVAGDGNSVSFNLGTLVNAGTNNQSDDFFEFEVTARSLGGQSEVAGDRLANTANFSADDVNVSTSNGVDLIEPMMEIEKTAGPSIVRAGEMVTYQVVIDNNVASRDAPAFDLVLTDVLDPNVTLDVGSVVVTGGTGVTIVSGNNGGDTDIEITIDRLDVGGTITIDYTATVVPDVEAAITIDNTADLTFDSLPTDDADDERDYSLSDDAEVVTASPEIDKTIIDTSYGDTMGTDLGIGEFITYEITVRLPEGDNTNSVLTDFLPTTPGTLTYVSSEVTAIGTNITGSSLAIGDSGTLVGNAVVFDFGDLNNFNDLMLDGRDDITVQVVAQLTDLADNEDGETLTNVGQFDTDNVSVSDSEDIDIVEPSLDIGKVADVTEADAGDTIEYTITSTNSGSGPAYDIVIDDDLGNPNIEAGVPAVASIRILDGAVDVTPGGADAPTVTFPLGGGELQAIIPVLLPGQTIEIVYEAIVLDTVAMDSSFDNTAAITRYDSDPAGDTDDPDDGRVYTGPTDTVEIDTPAPSITKTVISSDDPNTTDPAVGISEIITYEIEIVLPEGTSDILVSDDLPAGLSPVSAVITTMDAAISADITQGDTDMSSASIFVGADGGFVFDFGTLTNPGNNVAGDNTIVITVTAQVDDLASVNDGDTLTNTATLALVDPITGDPLIDPNTGQPQTYSDDAEIEIVEPSLDIEKTVTPTNADAGDTLSFTITSTNTGTGPAYDIIIDDAIDDPALTIPVPAVATIRIEDAGGNDVTPGGLDLPVVTYPTGADGLQAIIPVLLPDQTIIVEFEAVLNDDALFSSNVENTAQVTRFDTDPAGNGDDGDDGRVYDASLPGYVVPEDDAEITTPDLTLEKDYLSSNDGDTADGPQEVGIGEEITYRLTITAPEGTGDLTLVDDLPPGLTPISATVISLGDGANITTDNLTAGDTDASGFIVLTAGDVTFDFGTVVVTGTDDMAATDETIVVEIVARVEDIAAVVSGADLTNTATLSVTDPVTGNMLQDDVESSETVTVVEPDLELEKTGPIAANPGDTVTYTITVVNNGDGPAHDVFIEDVLGDVALSLSGTPTFDIDGSGITPTVNASGSGFSALVGTLLPGETLTVTYDVTLDAAAPEAQTFTNTASVDYDTVSDGDPDSPTGRDYSDEDDHRIGTVPVIIKDATDSSLAQTGNDEHDADNIDLVVGETVTYTITLVLPEIPMSSVVAVDTLPTGLQFVSAQLNAVGAGITGAAPTITNIGQVTTFDFGAVTNAFDGSIGADDEIEIEITALVLDDAAAVDGAGLVNTSTLDVTAGDGTVLTQAMDTETVDIVEPEIEINKTGPEAADPGDTVTYSVTLENTGTGPAFDVLFADTLSDPNLSLVSGTVAVTLDGVPQTPVINETGAGFDFLFDELLPGQVLEVTYDALLDAGAPAGESFVNTATADFDTVPDGDPDSPTGRNDDVSDDHDIGAGPLLEKSVRGSDIAQTGDGEHDPSTPDLVVGENVTFELLITFSEITMDSAVLVDTLPAGLSFVSASVESVGAGIVGAGTPTITNVGQLVTFDFGAVDNPFDGSIGADDEVVLLVTALVEDVAGNVDGAVLNNSATLTVTPQGQGPLAPATDDTDVEIVEPDLTIEKDGSIAVNPGDTVTYGLNVTNDGTGPAFDILVADTLGNPFLSYDSGSLTASITPAGGGAPVDITATLTVVETATGFEVVVPQLLPDETLDISYTATLDLAAPDAESFPNLATINYDTVPDGDPDSPTGRADTDDDEHLVATVPFVTKTPVATDFSETGSADGDTDLFDLNIGETVTYEYQVYLPEISMDSVVLSDTLDPELELISVSFVSAGAGMTVTNAPPLVTIVDAQNFTMDFGAVNNPNDGTIGPDDIITIRVEARVLDVPTAMSGDVVTNTVILDVDPTGPDAPFTSVEATADIEIVEPELTLEKTGPVAVNPGDTITYTLTLENIGDGPAYDSLIADTLSDPNLSLVGGTVALSLDGSAIMPTVNETGTGFDVMVPTILPGQVLVVTYDVVLSESATPAESYPNSASVAYDSVPDGDPDSPTGRSNGTDDDHLVATIPTIDKSVVDTSNADTSDGQGDPALADLSIGEEVTYELVLTLPEISMDLVSFTDTLPPGMEVVSASISSVGTGITSDAPVITTATGSVVIEFANLVNPFDGSIGADDEIRIEIVARVTDDSANANDGDVLTNTSALTVTPIGEDPLETQEDTADVEVVEPAVVLEKDGPLALNPGDTVTYTLTMTNEGTGPAYDILVQDALANPSLDLIAVTAATIDGADILAGLTISPLGDGFSTLVAALQPGEVLVITYDAVLDAAAPDANSFPNLATIDYDTVEDGDPDSPTGRTYEDEDDHSVATVPFLLKTATDSNRTETGSDQGDPDNLDLAIGEEVTYTLQIFLPEIPLDSVFLLDTLPVGFEFVSASVVSVGAGITGANTPVITNVGQDVSFDFGSVNNPFDGSIGDDDIITVQIVARVGDDPLNFAITTRTNEATLSVTPQGEPPFLDVTSSDVVDIVEPELSLEKTGPLAVNPGDTIEYVLTLENTGSGPAYDVSVSDPLLDADLTLMGGSVEVFIDGALQPIVAIPTGSGFDLQIPVISAGQTAEVRYSAILSATAEPAESYPNTASASFDVIPDGDPDTPGGRGGTLEDDHRVATIPTLTKEAVDSDNPDTGAGAHDPNLIDLTIGEIVTYELVLTLPEILMESVVLTDTLPTGLQFVSANVTSVGAGLVAGTPTIITSGQTVTLDFGAIENPFDGSIGADDEIRVELQAEVINVAAATDGAVLTNTSSLTVTPDGEDPLDTQTDDASVEVVEPQLLIDKTVSDLTPIVGDTITYTIVLSNDANATGPIYNVVTTDALPFQLELTGNVTLSDPALGSVTAGNVAGETTLVISVPRLLPGESLTIEYDVFVGFLTDVLTGITNVAETTGTSDPDPDAPMPRRYDTDDDETIVADPIPTDEDGRKRLPGLGIDDALFLPILSIDPIYSGTAEPGSNVTISLYKQDGSLDAVRNILADAGGHWIAIFPRVELDRPQEDFWFWYARSNIFDSPHETVDQIRSDGLGFPNSDFRSLVVGNRLDTDSYYLEVSSDRPSTLPQDRGMFNERTFYATAVTQEAFIVSDSLKVDEVFEDIAALTVERLYGASRNPLGEGLNRFNYEFLGSSTATPGSPH